MLDTLDTVKATAAQTGGTFGLIESRERGGSGPPLHVHEREDEAYYVLEGEYTFFVGDETIPAPAGTFLLPPRASAHIPDRVTRGAATRAHRAGRVGVVLLRGVPAGRGTTPSSTARHTPDFDRISAAASRRGVTILGPGPGTGDGVAARVPHSRVPLGGWSGSSPEVAQRPKTSPPPRQPLVGRLVEQGFELCCNDPRQPMKPPLLLTHDRVYQAEAF